MLKKKNKNTHDYESGAILKHPRGKSEESKKKQKQLSMSTVP